MSARLEHVGRGLHVYEQLYGAARETAGNHIGFAAGVAGLSTALATAVTFIITILCFILGNLLGKHISQKLLGKYSSILSALVLTGIGCYELIISFI